MKTTVSILALACATLAAQPLTQGERAYALSNLHASRKLLLDSIAGLTPAQWSFKPAPDRWSIAEIAEHLVLAEDLLFGRAKKMLDSPATPPRTVDRSQDAQVIARMADRTTKAQARPELQPTGRWATPAALAAEFKARRGRTIEYIDTTQDPLRAHVSGEGPDARDAYQVLLMVSAHTERHVAQILEVKAAPGYPR